ncbi:arsenate reductase ArsC [Luteithermobacter gelatinilyticus]|uniref:arsenate reductase ArsC n=1 Tax=Luteithermobacter gelatinilyticus TaxID=2582913 RepID=UPI001105C3E3|nr:arsenate reductase ArsC [Luteithermobacter gelatinilyticus]
MKLLFLCTHNACRSILAEAITRQLARKLRAEKVQVTSAGSHPAGFVNPLTLHYLHQKGYSTDDLTSKSWNDISEYAPDIVITVCDQAAGESCPIWLGNAVKGHWGLPDPGRNAQIGPTTDAAFTEIIELLENSISSLLTEDINSLTAEELSDLLKKLAPKSNIRK